MLGFAWLASSAGTTLLIDYASRGRMQTADTVQQRLTRLYQQRDNVNIGDLLTIVQHPDDLRSNAFKWAVMKLAFKAGRQVAGGPRL